MLLIESIDSLIEEQLDVKKIAKTSAVIVGILGATAAASIAAIIKFGQDNDLGEYQEKYDMLVTAFKNWMDNATSGSVDRVQLKAIQTQADELIEKVKTMSADPTNTISNAINSVKDNSKVAVTALKNAFSNIG